LTSQKGAITAVKQVSPLWRGNDLDVAVFAFGAGRPCVQGGVRWSPPLRRRGDALGACAVASKAGQPCSGPVPTPPRRHIGVGYARRRPSDGIRHWSGGSHAAVSPRLCGGASRYATFDLPHPRSTIWGVCRLFCLSALYAHANNRRTIVGTASLPNAIGKHHRALTADQCLATGRAGCILICAVGRVLDVHMLESLG
jgi:hypothetical protein